MGSSMDVGATVASRIFPRAHPVRNQPGQVPADGKMVAKSDGRAGRRRPQDPHRPPQRQLECTRPVSGLTSSRHSPFREHPAACGAFPGESHPVAALPLAPRRPLRGQRRLGLDREGLDAPASRLTRPSCEGRAPVAPLKFISACACRPNHCFLYRFVRGVARVQAGSESESST